MEKIVDEESRPLRLAFKTIIEITDNFSKDCVIGQGRSGVVYKGVYGDGQTMAVRKLSPKIKIDDEQFHKAISSLMTIQHQNIIGFIGYSSEQEQVILPYNGRHVFSSKTDRVLCFEYMQNGSLDHYISDISYGLDWHVRYRIIKGLAEALAYLHEGSKSPVIHMDLKPRNVLLDQNMTPKIGDFGISRLVGEGNVRHMGSVPYMAPEFIGKQVISDKCDLFSFGVVIMELMTGIKPVFNDVYSDKFSEMVREKWRVRLQKTVNFISIERYCRQVTKCLEIALKCMEYDRYERPSIGEIINMLNEIETFFPEEVRAVQSRFDSRKSLTLDVYPLELYFPFPVKERKDITSCSLHLKNRGGDRVAFILVANIPKSYMIKKPLCGVVHPRTTCTLILEKLKQTPPTSADSNDFFTLYITVVGVGQYHFIDVEKDYTHYNNFFKKSTEYGGNVHVVKIKVISDGPAVKSTVTPPEDRGGVSRRGIAMI